MYEYVLDKAWSTGMTDAEWVEKLADRHAGCQDENVREAWKVLTDSVYVDYSVTGNASLTCAHPCMEGNWLWTTRPDRGYSLENLLRAWGLLLESGSDRDAYLFDVVNVGRQYLGDIFLSMRDSFAAAYRAGDLAGMEKYGEKMLGIFDDMERLVACHRSFYLSTWIEAARGWGQTEEQKDYYEKNARTLLTVWGDSPALTDYASRSWTGLISTYYKARWQMFIEDAMQAVKEGRLFDQKKFDERIHEFERSWTEPSYVVEFSEGGDAVGTAKEIYAKYNSEKR